jgi:FkbM family methyltransferase
LPEPKDLAGSMRAFNKPEYFYRPHQVLKRIQYSFGTAKRTFKEVPLPWGLNIRVRPNEEIGRSLCTYGLYDLVVTEVLLRLLEAGEVALDIGANIGYMTAVMATRLGSRGKVISFEPARRLFEELCWNVEQWSTDSRLARIEVHQIAVSSGTGNATLYFPENFSRNCGLATLERRDGDEGGVLENVQTADLDGLIGPNQQVGLLKLDVEGHEPSVIRGAHGLLSGGRVRDIVFEDHGPYPSATQLELLSFGFSVYRLSRTFGRPVLLEPENNRGSLRGFPPNFLATRDPERVKERFAEPGWKALRSFRCNGDELAFGRKAPRQGLVARPS